MARGKGNGRWDDMTCVWREGKEWTMDKYSPLTLRLDYTHAVHGNGSKYLGRRGSVA